MREKEKTIHLINVRRPTYMSYLGACYAKRYLAVLFAERDIRVKYAQTSFGIGWALFQPLVAILLYGGIYATISGEIPYQGSFLQFLCIGVLGWNLFYYVAQQSSTALLQHQDLLKKIRFPRFLLLASKGLVGLLDFGLGLVCLLIFLLMEGVSFSLHWLGLPLAVLSIIISALGVGTCLAATSLWRRDLQHALPLFLHATLWLSPVFYYSYHTLPQPLGVLVAVNPLSEALYLLRWSLLGESSLSGALPFLGWRSVGMLLFLGFAIRLLSKNEHSHADTY